MAPHLPLERRLEEKASSPRPPEDNARAPTPEGGTSGLASPRKDLSQGRWGDFSEEQVTEDMPKPYAEEEDEIEEEDSPLCVGDVSSKEKGGARAVQGRKGFGQH